MNVFITFLVGGGVILSGLAWIVDWSRRRRPRPPARNDWLASSTRSATRREACCSTTSRCSRKRSREPTTIRSASRCAVADAREQAHPDAPLGLVLAIGVVGVLALREATLSTHEQVAARETELVVSARTKAGESNQTLDEMVEAQPLTCRLEVTSDLASPIEPLGDGSPCSLRRWTRQPPAVQRLRRGFRHRRPPDRRARADADRLENPARGAAPRVPPQTEACGVPPGVQPRSRGSFVGHGVIFHSNGGPPRRDQLFTSPDLSVRAAGGSRRRRRGGALPRALPAPPPTAASSSPAAASHRRSDVSASGIASKVRSNRAAATDHQRRVPMSRRRHSPCSTRVPCIGFGVGLSSTVPSTTRSRRLSSTSRTWAPYSRDDQRDGLVAPRIRIRAEQRRQVIGGGEDARSDLLRDGVPHEPADRTRLHGLHDGRPADRSVRS